MKYIVVAYLTLMVIGVIASFENNKAHSQTLKPFISKDIYLHGEISDEMALGVGGAIKQLNAEGVDEIIMHITSPGGEVYAGLQIYDYMHQSKAKIRTICEGYCMSMAAYLLTLGDTRQASAHSTIMFHQVSTEIKGKLYELSVELCETQRLQNTINELVKSRSGMSINDLNAMEKYDHYMTPQEVKNLNLIDNIIGE